MMKVHFFNVGHGECTLIEHPSGRLTMVDINTSHDYDQSTRDEILKERASARGGFGIGSQPTLIGAAMDTQFVEQAEKAELTDPIAFLQNHYRGRSLWRFILTHPDLDHMRGLKRLRETVGFTNFWDTRHTKATPGFRSDTDREEWEHYQKLRNGEFEIRPRFYLRGEEHYAFARDENGLGDGDGIEILSPTKDIVAACNEQGISNDISYVLRVRHARRTVLLTGDVETMAWSDLETHFRHSLKSDFLQASHHGRDSGYHASSLRLIDPSVVVVSVGRKPETDAHAKYKTVCANVWSTRRYGTLTLTIDDQGQASWGAERNGS